jgi:hypothetical protein
MFFSEQYKVHWWGPPRIASRALMLIPTALGFNNNRDGHNPTIINPEWDVVLPIRNPYSRAVSWWHLRHNEPKIPDDFKNISFEEFIRKDSNEYLTMDLGTPWEPISQIRKHNLKIRNIIRYEHLVDDLMQIDFVIENFETLKEPLYNLKYQQRDAYRNDYIQHIRTPVCSFYTQELADIVWEKKQFEFQEWGYEKDSWKYLL